MHKNKKIISGLLIFLMMIGFGNISLAKTGNEKIDWLVEKKFVVGGGDGDLNLNGNLTREEAATIIVKALGKESLAPLYQNIENKFTDMNAKTWSNGMVNAAVEANIVSGYPDNTFRPKENITYQEIVVMLVQVKGGLTEEEVKSAPWPTPYILKADQLGILDGIKIDDVKAKITRLKAFEMLYNTVAKEDIDEEGLYSYKALVTEIERVHAIDENELGLVILESAEGNKYSVNDYTRARFNNIDNVDDLLGKVIKVKLDENNNIKSYEIDNSYKYVAGLVEFKRDEALLMGDTYDILSEGSLAKANDKLHFVYHNDEKINYNDLYNKETSDFARITLDRDKVIAIESFDFSKVEPIEKVDGNKVTFTDGRTIAVDGAIMLQDNSLVAADLKDVDELNVGHVYDDNKLLISNKIDLKGKLDNVVSRNGKDVVVKIDDKEYKVSNKFNMLYSTDGEEFIVLDSEKAYDDIYLLRGQEVAYGLDAANNIKYIVSSKVQNEDFYIVDRALVKEIRLIDSNGNKVEFEIDLKSKLENSQGKKLELKDLSSGDLVYILKDGKYIEKLSLVKDFNGIKNSSVKVDKDSQGKFTIDRRYIANKDARSFLFYEDGKELKEVKALELEKILSNASLDSNLRVFMFSDYEFDKLGLSKNVITSGVENRINLFIFTGFKQTTEGTIEELVKLRYDFKANYDDEIEGFIGEEPVRIKLDKNTKLQNLAVGDYIKVYMNSEDKIVKGELIFRDADKFIEVVDVDTSSGKLIEITVMENGKAKSYWVSKEHIELGTAKKGSFVKLHLDNEGEVDIILVK
ncbi:S-layer homology domain-containing protein [Tissierella carlieri]|uniref:S-layer homology domain-containing protein n=1 Tax=Tissierella carlieri TaxID=689904 RepID=UPI001C11273A|nr:S-layer homology domain-containing protein [Tissierella carlieri]MBU5313130.1 S-layer homology domain-containing protein [Tissierella carlieri]